MTSDMYDQIGKPRRRVDGRSKASGKTLYADDVSFPRMLHCKILRATVPHANIVNLDVSKAEAMDGVHLVLTGKDLSKPYGILLGDDKNADSEIGLIAPTFDETPLAVKKVRFVGDPVAAVIADDEATAYAALALIDVEYEELETISTPLEAIKTSEPRIHTYGQKGNYHRRVSYEFGDASSAIDDADHVFDDVFFYEGNTHLPIEQHAAVADVDYEGRATLWSSTQVPHYAHLAAVQALEIPLSHLRVIATPPGGGFGGKTDPINHEIIVIKAAMLLGRPVKIALTREEVFYSHRGRHPTYIQIRTGVSKTGEIKGLHIRSLLDGGSYASYGITSLFYTGALNTSTYKIPKFKFEGARVFTNKPPCGAKRGNGTPQSRFAQEIQMDIIANTLNIDPADFRLANLQPGNSVTADYTNIGSSGLRTCIERVVEMSDWRSRYGKLPKGKGLGLAVGCYVSGASENVYPSELPMSGVQLKLDRSGTVTAFFGGAEIGQGSDTVLVTIVAEILGIDPLDITCVTGDTSLTPVDLGAYSSRVTLMLGNAAIQASERAKKLISEAVAARWSCTEEELVFGEQRVRHKTDPKRSLTFQQAVVCAEELHGTLGTTGGYAAPKAQGQVEAAYGSSPAHSFTAVVIEVDVDPDTGWVTVPKIYTAHDLGRALNPVLALGQVEGGIYMGLSEALMEESAFRRLPKKLSGALVHKFPSMLEYKNITTLDMPELISELIEDPDPNGPFGAKEVGQGPLLPVMPALSNAVYDAVGVRIHELPITADRIMKAMEEKEKGSGQRGRVGPKRFPDVDYPEPWIVPPPWEGGDGSPTYIPSDETNAKSATNIEVSQK